MKVEEFKIKGMICSRCVKVLTIELRNTGAEILEIQLGRIVIKYDSKLISRTKIIDSICENDFEIIKDPRLILSEQIKKWVIYYVWNTFHEEKLSNYLERKLNKSYNLISKNFHESVGMSIDRYQVILKIERTKELLEEGQLSFSEVAYSVGYQSLSALSKQFKKETEMTLKEYKNLEVGTRVPLDKI